MSPDTVVLYWVMAIAIVCAAICVIRLRDFYASDGWVIGAAFSVCAVAVCLAKLLVEFFFP